MAPPVITSGNYELVLEPSAIAGLSDGTAIGTWTDGSGLSHNATQATGANQPLKQTVTNNGKTFALARLDGTNDSLSVAGVTNNDTSRTVFIVAKGTSIAAPDRSVFALSATALVGGRGSDAQWFYYGNQVDAAVTFGGNANTAWSCVTCKINSTSSLDLYLDTGSATNLDPEDTFAGGAALTIGANSGGGASFWPGDIAAVIVVDAAVSDADRQSIVNYLGSICGTPTFPAPPTVTTLAASSIGATGATLNATVNPQGKGTTAQFEYGLTTGYGTTVSLGTVGSDIADHALSSAVSSLTTGLTYHYRIVATNADGTTNGLDVTFTPAAPAISYVPAIQVGLWSFVLCDGSGTTITTLTRNQGTRLTFTRNGVPECELSLSHDDDECAFILTALKNGTGGGVPTLKGYRIGRDGISTLRFNGYLAAVSEESGTEASSATFTFTGPFQKYLGDGDSKGIYTGNPAFYTYTNTDAGLIAKALIDSLGGGGSLVGLTTTGGTFQTSKNRDRTYPWANVGSAIVNLTSVLDGFDFEVAPVDQGGVLGVLSVYARQGSDRPAAKFEYGPPTLANCSAIHRQTLPPINAVRVFGASGLVSTGNQGFVEDVASQFKYGYFGHQVTYSDVTEQATIDDKARALIRPNPVKAIDFTPEPRLGPSPWDDYWIGDTIRFYASRNALVEGPSSVRVNQITVAIDPNTGLEAAEIPDPLDPEEERVLRASLQTEVAEGAVL